MPTVGLDGTRFYYEERGKGPALVIVPDTGVDTSMLAAAARLFEDAHRVITYDRRGFGRTDVAPPRAKTYLRRHGDDLAALLRELGAVPATVVGWRWGALVALTTAAFHPTLVKDLVLFEPPLHARRPLRATMFGKAGFEQRAAKRFFASTFAKKTWKSLDESVRTKLLASTKAVAAELDAGNGEELTSDVLARVKAPISVVLGKGSPLTPLVRIYPRANVVRLEQDDPFAIVRSPAAFVDVTRQVTRSLARSP